MLGKCKRQILQKGILALFKDQKPIAAVPLIGREKAKRPIFGYYRVRMGSPLRPVLKVTVSNPVLEFQATRVRLPALSPVRVVNSSLRSVQESRIPHKYDHFHEKTYEVDFVPKFYVKRFERKSGQVYGRPLELLHAFRLVTGKREVARTSRAHSVLTRRTPSKSPTPLRKETTLSATPARQLHRMVLCVQDGAELDSSKLHTLTLDLGAILHRCFAVNRTSEVANVLAQHALDEVLEQATLSLHPNVPFSALYYVSGEPVSHLAQVPPDCKVLVAGWADKFLGLR